ncbi:MAG TPA: hypothetical protein PK228_05555 [Saprospiraceae bacterium]|nr:hypothetical protein [Saprospiraceae bacterium]
MKRCHATLQKHTFTYACTAIVFAVRRGVFFPLCEIFGEDIDEAAFSAPDERFKVGADPTVDNIIRNIFARKRAGVGFFHDLDCFWLWPDLSKFKLLN